MTAKAAGFLSFFLVLASIGMVPLATAYAADVGPSFDCELAKSPAEQKICSDPFLSKLDLQLGQIFKDAEARIKNWVFAGEGRNETPWEWFKRHHEEEWLDRETRCKSDVSCLTRWYARRKAVLSWIAYSEDSVGDFGITSVVQLRNSSTIITYFMATHFRNVIYDPKSDNFSTLPDGEITILSEEPLRYFLKGKKSYFNEGGAFWFNSIRDHKDRILTIEPSDTEYPPQCFTKDDFANKTPYSLSDLSLVEADRVCVS